MKTKGFTLIELIAVILILSLIFLVSFPSILNMNKADVEKQYNDMVESLCMAGKSYIYSNMDNYPNLSIEGEIIEVKIEELITYGSVSKDKKNIKTNKTLENDRLLYTVLSDYSLSCKYE